MHIFESDNYKSFVKHRIKSMPQNGHGEFRKIAKALKMHTSLVSQIFNGSRDLSLEQALDLCSYWGMNSLETDFFLLLVQKERAGTKSLKELFQKKIEIIIRKSEKLNHLLPQEAKLTEESQAIFYSNWHYSAIRLLSSIPGYHSVDAIAERLNLSRKITANAVSFLLERGLCILKNEKIFMGPKRTHLSSDSPLISRHHMNWRNKAAARLDNLQDHELMFTAPLSLSHRDALKIKRKILQFVSEVSTVVEASPAEKIACLNIDWFDV